MTKLVGAFLQFPGVFVTIFIVLSIFKRRRGYLYLALLSYVLTVPVFWIPVQRIWTVSDEPTGSDVVVLGGGILKAGGGYEPTRATLARLKKAFEVWREVGGRIFVSGGKGFEDVSEAEVMKGILLEWGVPEDLIIVEGRSSSTRENALFLKESLPEKFNLVTSSTHTRRAKMVFEKMGKEFRVIAADYVLDESIDPYSFVPSGGTLIFLSELTHEIIGIVYYALTGGV